MCSNEVLQMTQRETSPSSGGVNWLVQLFGNLRLAWCLLRDPLVPVGPKLIPLGAFVYILLPSDLVPDFILGLGQVDDFVIFLLSLKLFIGLCPPEIVQRHLAEMSSIKAAYRVVKEEQPQPTDVAGYLDVESRVLPDDGTSSRVEPVERDSDQAR